MAIKVQQYIAISAEDVKTSFEELATKKGVCKYGILQ